LGAPWPEGRHHTWVGMECGGEGPCRRSQSAPEGPLEGELALPSEGPTVPGTEASHEVLLEVPLDVPLTVEWLDSGASPGLIFRN
jgi:hypothetical protein